MLTASIRNGKFTYRYWLGGKPVVTIRASKEAIKPAIPYLESKIKKVAH